MLVYRVFPFDPSAADGASGHPAYLHRPQGKGRLDNPRHYDVWYFAASPEAAVGEVFGDITVWGDDMFVVPALPNALRTLGVFEVPDDVQLLDLDDAQALLTRGLRPTHVIARNRAVTQEWALRVFLERNDLGARRWDGVQWWSFHRPHWTVLGLWYAPGEIVRQRLVDTEELHVGHPAVVDAARTLGRTFV